MTKHSQDSDTTDYSQLAAQISHATGMQCTYTHSHSFSQFEVHAFTLKNGLTILLHPDGRAPIFSYQTWFKVGSKDEEPHRTGMAHLFEHLMFKATRTHKNGVFDREMERRGCQTNAATWVDWTYYYESLAARDDNLETVIAFEADRMVNLIVDEDTFRSELEVVKNERRQTVDDSVSGRLSERLFDLAYTKHAYRWPTIGSMEHLEAATVATLTEFYERFYAPNNAVVVLSGDFEMEHALKLIAQAYGRHVSQEIVRPKRVTEPVQEKARRCSFNIQLTAPVIAVGFPVPGQNTDEFAAIEMLSDALVSGDSARLYRRLVTQERLCTDVDGYLPPFADPGLYEFVLSLRPGADVDAVLNILQEELTQLAQGLSVREIEKARNSCELAQWDTFKDAESCAEALGHFQCNYGDFSLAFSALNILQRLDDAALREAASTIFAAHRQNVVVAYPQTNNDTKSNA